VWTGEAWQAWGGTARFVSLRLGMAGEAGQDRAGPGSARRGRLAGFG
jgi:hypothetical protein